MAYLNNIYGNAAYVGCLEGMLNGRQNNSASTSYTLLKAAALQFAAEVDALITFDALVSTGSGITQLAITTNTIAANEQWRAGLLQALCAAEMSSRYSESADTSIYNSAAAAIFAAWTALVAGLVTP